MDRGNRLKILRMLCGRSQDALAKELVLSQGNVATWERKGMFPRDHKIAMRLAELLQAPVGYLAFGDPQIDCAVWAPQPPQNPRHLKSYLSDIKSLLSEFCKENRIAVGVYCIAENGVLVFLGQEGKPLSYLLIIVPDVAEYFLEALGGIKIDEIPVLTGYPPLAVDFSKYALEQLDFYFRVIETSGYSIEAQAIGAAFVKIRKAARDRIDIPHSIENTFRIFHSTLQEYDVPQLWPEDLMIRLSHIFSRLHELVVEKPIVGEVMMDKSLSEYIEPMLTESGLKKKESQ